MEHPLIANIDHLSVEELQSRITELNKKLAYAVRTNNGHLAGQIRMAIETFNTKYQEKLSDLYKKSGSDFSDRINIS